MQTWRDKRFSDNFAKIHFISTIVTFFDSDSPNLVLKLWVIKRPLILKQTVEIIRKNDFNVPLTFLLLGLLLIYVVNGSDTTPATTVLFLRKIKSGVKFDNKKKVLEFLYVRWNTLRDLVPFIKLKNHEEHPWKSDTFSKGFRLQLY